MMPDDFLMIFAKAPVAGLAKTRLFPHISFEEAAALHQAMVTDMVDICLKLQKVRLRLCYTPAGSAELFKDLLGDRRLEYREQEEGDLGERMYRSFLSAFSEGARRAVIVGTDVPSIPPFFIRGAFHRLLRADLVLGPAHDGGYYLVGLNRPVPDIFTGVAWSSASVLGTTLEIAGRLGLKTELLPKLKDIDTFEGLREAASGPLPPLTGKVVAGLHRRISDTEWLV